MLTVVTGLMDAFGYLMLGHVFVANMTGNVVFLSFDLGVRPGSSGGHRSCSARPPGRRLGSGSPPSWRWSSGSPIRAIPERTIQYRCGPMESGSVVRRVGWALMLHGDTSGPKDYVRPRSSTREEIGLSGGGAGDVADLAPHRLGGSPSDALAVLPARRLAGTGLRDPTADR
ncbi:hypothetical protein Kisp02_22180 [Kineosporia sp. NBRC 101731]|nr:hypothetical protein Kisp02_22180 [Kineosporia sp. NBRC 101731]